MSTVKARRPAILVSRRRVAFGFKIHHVKRLTHRTLTAGLHLRKPHRIRYAAVRGQQRYVKGFLSHPLARHVKRPYTGPVHHKGVAGRKRRPATHHPTTHHPAGSRHARKPPHVRGVRKKPRPYVHKRGYHLKHPRKKPHWTHKRRFLGRHYHGRKHYHLKHKRAYHGRKHFTRMASHNRKKM
jgi:hypothetical protein